MNRRVAMIEDAVPKLVVRFCDVPDMQFFRVTSSDGSPELDLRIFVCVPDSKLPQELRKDDGKEVLFAVSSVQPGYGYPTEIEVESVPDDIQIPENAVAQFCLPVDETLLLNGARVFIWSDRVPAEEFLFLGRVTQDGMLDTTPSRHRYSGRLDEEATLH